MLATVRWGSDPGDRFAFASQYWIGRATIVSPGEQTLELGPEHSGTISGSGLTASLDTDDPDQVNAWRLQSYADKIEINGKPYTVEQNQFLALSHSDLAIRNGRAEQERASGDSLYHLKHNSIVIPGPQEILLPRGCPKATIRGGLLRAKLAGVGAFRIDGVELQNDAKGLRMDGELVDVPSGHAVVIEEGRVRIEPRRDEGQGGR